LVAKLLKGKNMRNEETNLYTIYKDILTQDQCACLKNFFTYASVIQKAQRGLEKEKTDDILLKEKEKYFDILHDFYSKLDREQFQKFFAFFQKQSQLYYHSPYRLIKDFSREDWPAAAGICGDKEEVYIPSCKLQSKHIPYKINIVGKKSPQGYFLWVQSDLSIKLLLIFFKGQKELMRREISKYPDPKNPIPYNIMQNEWDCIRILKILEA